MRSVPPSHTDAHYCICHPSDRICVLLAVFDIIKHNKAAAVQLVVNIVMHSMIHRKFRIISLG